MSAHQTSCWAIRCDGCGTETQQHDCNAFTARLRASSDGWTFPSRTTTSGKLTSRTSDVCPKCTPTWDPRPAVNRSGR